MLIAMLIFGAAIGIVLAAVWIVIGWISKPAAARFARALNVIGSGFLKVVIVLLAVGIVVLVWTAIRSN